MKTTVQVALMFCFLFCSTAFSGNLPENRVLSIDQWQEDVRFLVDHLLETHPNPFFASAHDEFTDSVDSLLDGLADMSDDDIVVELMRITSRLKDGHTRLHGRHLTKSWFPVRMYEFEDGIFITAIHEDYADAIGSKVITIGNFSAEESLGRIKDIAAHDNEHSLKYSAPMYLTMTSIMNGLDIVDDPNCLKMTIEKEGQSSELILPANAYESDNDFKWYWMFNSVPAEKFVRHIDHVKIPLVYRNLERFYWFEYLEKEHTVYMCFNLCDDSTDENFLVFNTRLWKFIESSQAKRLIIDLRNNIGGNNQILLPLIHETIMHKDINTRENLHVIIGRKTWSASMHCATWFERHTNAAFIGEPTASAPNHYADPVSFTLPNSKIELLVSRYYWQNGWPWDERICIEPEIFVKLHSHEYFGCRDPVLEILLENMK